MTIFVGNLDDSITDEELKEVFSEYGSVKKAYIPLDRETRKARGFGFVEMSSDAEEEEAIAILDGAEWMERTLRVNKARPKSKRNSPGR